MKHHPLLLMSVFFLGWGLVQGGALAAPGEAKQQSNLKDMGKPAFKDTVLTREQYLKQQEEFKRLAEEERVQSQRFKEAFEKLREEFRKEGVKISRPKQSDAWHLIVPELSKVTGQAQKTKGKALVTRFKAKLEPLVKEKIKVEVYPDAKQTKPLSL